MFISFTLNTLQSKKDGHFYTAHNKTSGNTHSTADMRAPGAGLQSSGQAVDTMESLIYLT